MHDKIIEIKEVVLSKLSDMSKWLDNWRYRNVTLYGLIILLIILTAVRGCVSEEEVAHSKPLTKETVQQKIAEAERKNSVPESELVNGLPKGWSIMTNGDEFCHKDDKGYQTRICENSYEEAVEAAVRFYNYKVKEKYDNWVEIK